MKVISHDFPNVHVYSTREEMGKEASEKIEAKIVELLKIKDEVRMIFAAAPSQNEMLAHLSKSKKIDWNKIIAFNMDEYVGLAQDSPQSFAGYLNNHLFNHVNCKKKNLINGLSSPEEETKKHADLLSEQPIDIVCLGIGENGHIAFNDPPVADFNDPEIVKIVELDEACRTQQVNDKCFEKIEDVPKKAFTITIPVIMQASYLFCVVPGKTKRKAVYESINGEVTEKCPASILRQHPSCNFFFDTDSFGD